MLLLPYGLKFLRIGLLKRLQLLQIQAVHILATIFLLLPLFQSTTFSFQDTGLKILVQSFKLLFCTPFIRSYIRLSCQSLLVPLVIAFIAALLDNLRKFAALTDRYLPREVCCL